MTKDEVIATLKADPSYILKIAKTEWANDVEVMLLVVKINPTAIYMGTPEIKDNPIIVRAIVQALIDSKEVDFKILQVIQNNCSTRIEEYLEPFNTNNYIKALDSLILQQELEEKLSNDKPKAKTIHH